MPSEKTRKTLAYSAWGLLFLSLVGVLVIQAFQETPQPSKTTFLSDLIIVTARTTPQNRKIDEDITFVRAQAANSHALKFYYTLTRYDTHPDDIDLDVMKSNITQATCAAQLRSDQSILSQGGTLIYIFGSKNVKEVGQFEINKQSCEG
ncbi:hypothetical protein [Pseudomonas lactucae]|uniref:Uncharacterized protein n=1 Tax=Pseudomonas lactucae TaxID=2813360 RepID=A0A9X0YG70_9PSED|nr:hypothetical protein [Pseudomonas lactucae]MBN2978750.1 hypothetical protein [Pseudomonas lactucae]MBN2986021.1 hypothetical protein [Pseudomonas lactucae]